MPKAPSYGIIYNWDGAPHGFSEYPQSMEAFLDKMYAPMRDTQVGAHFWCMEQHQARWKSKVLEVTGDVYGRHYESVSAFTSIENVRAMLERGEDPQEAAIIRGRELGMHVYASVRMNDNHFNGAKPEDMPQMRDTALTQMRIDHPEWLLGDRTTEWFALSWDFTVPEVREHRYRHIEELCTLYDWDGVELDWLRHAFHLPEDYAYRMRYILTDLQRVVRRMTNELGEKRGRPFYVAARVSANLDTCRRIGFDIPTWVDEGLVDILIPSGMSDTDPSIDVQGFVELCRGTDTAVYPGLDTQERFPGHAADSRGPQGGPPAHMPRSAPASEDHYTKDKMLNRAMAARYHEDGADGIYIFNWYSDGETRRELLNQIGSPDTLRRKDKIFATTHRYLVKAGAESTWYGAFHNDRVWGEVPVALKRTLTGDGPTVTLDVVDDLAANAPREVELRIRLEEWMKGDVVRVLWDGAERDDMQSGYHPAHDNYANPFASPVSDVSDAVWLTCRLDPSKVSKGLHAVKVVLVQRHPQVDSDVVLTDVEVAVKYD